MSNATRGKSTKSLDSILFVLCTLAAIAWCGMGCGEKNSGSSLCTHNLRLIYGIKDQWAVEHSKTTNDVPTWDDLKSYFPSEWTGKNTNWRDGKLVCPEGGTYTLGKVGAYPTCSIGGPHHSLQ